MLLKLLKYSFFNITKGDSMNDILNKCANRAYLDLCRTIKFKTDAKNDEKVKIEYKEKVCEKIVKEYDILLNAVENSDEKQNAFDSEHNRICEEIIKIYSEISDFTYGQAQKWLNMTLKYFLLIEEDSKKGFVLKEYLHVPVDSYIMQAVGSDNPKLKHCLKLECVPKKDGTLGKYSESNSKAWSKWEYEDYDEFQKSIRTGVSKSDYSSPIEWENVAWIEVAKFRKQIANCEEE